MVQQDKQVNSAPGSVPVMSGARRSQSQEGVDCLLTPPVNGGALCNDALGLCIGSRGTIDTAQSGIYTTIARLAARLDEQYADNDERPRGEIESTGTSSSAVTPLVTIETDRATVLVKEYEGNAVVFRVPRCSKSP